MKEFELIDELLGSISDPDYDLSPHRDAIIAGMQRMRSELIEAESFDFRKIGDSIYDGIYITDGLGKTIYVNQAYSRITGISAEEVLGQYVQDLTDQGLWKNAVSNEVIKQKKQVNSLAEVTRTGKKALVTGIPLFDASGNVSKAVVIDRDITDLLEIRAELEASQAKIKTVEKDQHKDRQEIELLRKMHTGKNLIGNSESIQNIARVIHQIANLDITVLITGETGTGKEVVANEIYSSCKRSKGAFIKINCAAIPPNLLETELFGYERGAFTGADNAGRLGMFELADQGTLLLDEVGEIPLELQAKLLRVIQEKEITRIGGRKPVRLDVRVIASTNRNLTEMIKTGKFRRDLYYRLNVFPICLPPLRERPEDIAELARHFLTEFNMKYGKDTVFEHACFEVMQQYSWPGNVREMQNVIERLVIVADRGCVVTAEEIGDMLAVDSHFARLFHCEMGLKEILANMERKTIEKALEYGGSTRRAAELLKIDQSNVVRKAKKLGIRLRNFDEK